LKDTLAVYFKVSFNFEIKMRDLLCGFFLLLMIGSGHSYFEILNEKIQLRLFTPGNYRKLSTDEREDREALWEVGTDLECTVHENGEVEVYPPSDYDPDFPLKVVSGGFLISTKGVASNIVKAWMESTNQRTNVILIEWNDLNHHNNYRLAVARSFINEIFVPDRFQWSEDVYLDAAMNAIHAGQYVGLILAALAKRSSIDFNIHLAGHSLGAHLVGIAGRSYEKATGKKVARVTGLDPAGPSFIDGPIVEADPELFKNRLNKNDAEFVDIIHSQGSLSPAVLHYDSKFGDLNPLGHADFYPDGGETQENCQVLLPLSKVGCSHERGFHYFINSIQEPDLFPSYECSSLDECRQARSIFSGVDSRGEGRPDSYMGEKSIDYKTERSKLYFLKLDKDVSWDYYSYGKIESILKRRIWETLLLAKHGLTGGGFLPKLGLLPSITSIPKNVVQKAFDWLNKLPWNFDVLDVRETYCENFPSAPSCFLRNKYCEMFPLAPSCVGRDTEATFCERFPAALSCLREEYCEQFPSAPSCWLLGK